VETRVAYLKNVLFENKRGHQNLVTLKMRYLALGRFKKTGAQKKKPNDQNKTEATKHACGALVRFPIPFMQRWPK
jgi:hypothetical protein